MREKELAEIKRRFKADKNNIGHVVGCYVSSEGEIVSKFKQPLVTMGDEEKEKMFAVLKKSLSGTPGKNLLDIEFSTKQVEDSPEHSLLMNLRQTKLEDADAIDILYSKITESVSFEEGYLILLAYDTYDVFQKTADGEIDDFGGDEVFSYFVCCITPVKVTKPALGFYASQNAFHNCKSDWLVGSPSLGFMFPAFDDRSTNIYNALLYTKDTKSINQNFIESIFNCEPPVAAQVQKEIFSNVLAETLNDDCSYGVIQSVHEKVSEAVLYHKESGDEDPLLFSKHEFKDLLSDCGISNENLENFTERFSSDFGEDAVLRPQNIIDIKKFDLKTPDITVTVNPAKTELVQTQMIDGVNYLMIKLVDEVEVNGISISRKSIKPSAL